MKNVKITVLLACVSLPVLCHAQLSAASPLKPIAWLLGTWQMQEANGTLYEQWRVANDSTFTGRGYSIKTGSKDTTLNETLRLEYREGGLTFYAAVAQQNGDKAVPFAATHISADSLRVENPMHDYPTALVYAPTSGGLLARVRGPKGAGGVMAEQVLRFTRKQ